MNQNVPEVFYIEREAFLRMMLEKYAKHQQLEVYTVDGSEAVGFLIDDLRPKRLLVDAQTFLQMPENHRLELLKASDIPVIWTGFPDELAAVAKALPELAIKSSLPKPIEASSLLNQLLAIGR